ncbi:MAG: Serine phosphatase RsbU, regulator of sigma subunit [uncultured Solirubrobacteraceae bacterium]|uniref:Serine phosphatase RsbU, regulator of sigma subunit n=1 Tax=uncultured Solirubrobacteraceae bacterium TaxID=1162706 RepID=A0A6J4TMB2_9ACTN|nr:MAG: Serine phosphatase RsbU, regulator of sigma subunit [uncultured Solirubrobacteraceae bacterium]
MTEALGQLAEAVTVHDTAGRLLYVNDAAVRLLGFGSARELLAAPPGALMAGARVFHPDGRPVDQADLPGRRVLEGEDADPLLVRWIAPDGGPLRWSVIKARALRDEHGDPVAAVNVIEDVTDVKEAELSQRLLAEAAQILASSMDHRSTLEHVAELAVPHLADWCGVDLVDEHGRIEQVAVAHVDPDRVSWGRELRRRYPVDPASDVGIAQVIRTGEVQLAQDITADLLAAAAQDPEHLALLQEVGFRSVLIVPLVAGARTVGALTLVLTSEARRYTPADVALAEELGRRAGTAVENARLFTERGRIAELLQASLLPDMLPPLAGWDTATLFRPAGDMNLVGGDFYDALPTEQGMLVCVGDVAGKGAVAAALTGRVRHALTSAVALGIGLPRALEHVNGLLLARPGESMCTIAAALLREDASGAHAVLCLAGHPPPVVVRASGGASFAPGHGTVLGAVPDPVAPPERIDLEPGDALVLFTDGVTDAGGEEERFGFDRLLACLGEAGTTAPEGLVAALERALAAFQHGPQRDDVAVLAVRRTPSGDPP